MSHIGDKNTVATGTEASNAVTINATDGVITTSSLVNAALGGYAITLTNSTISATSSFRAWAYGYSGTLITNGIYYLTWGAPGSGTIVLNVMNLAPVLALSGTLKIRFKVEN